MIGIPVFAYGGGPGYVLQPTFGYLVGYVFTAYLVGRLTEKHEEPGSLVFLRANLLGLLVTYAFGVVYLYIIINLVSGKVMAFTDALWFGAVICSPGDLLLVFVAARVSVKMINTLPYLRSTIGKQKGDITTAKELAEVE